MKLTALISFLAIAALPVCFSTLAGCAKEYSCEGCFARDTATGDTIPADTTMTRDSINIDSTIHFPVCPTCPASPAYVLNRWSCRNYQSFICGSIADVHIDSEDVTGEYDITFRGFQDCAGLTQFELNGVFPAHLFDADRAKYYLDLH